jgi:beta-glucosidase
MLVDRGFGLPIYVLENGTAADDEVGDAGQIQDTERIAYLRPYIEAIAAGADILGYFAWSLLDNFEWDSGFSQRFGLVYVDYLTQRRIPKASVQWYSDCIAAARATAPVPADGVNPPNAIAAKG